MGHPEYNDDPDVNTPDGRIKNKPKMIEYIESWLREFDDIGEAVALIDAAGLPVGKVKQCWELAHDEQFLARGGIIDMAMSPQAQAAGMPETMKFRNPEVTHYSLTPRSEQRNGVWAPELGEHNHEILDKYLGAEEVDRLQAKWAAQ